jgi:hypothetical protein
MQRAIHTAARMNKHFGVAVEQTAALDPDGTPEKAWKAVRKIVAAHEIDDQHVLIITHDPLIMPMLCAACFQFDPGHNIFNHGAMIHFHTGEHQITNDPEEVDACQVKWYVTPRTAHKLRESLAVARVAEETERLTEHLLRKGRRDALEPLEQSLALMVRLYLLGHSPWQPARITSLLTRAYQQGAAFCIPMLPGALKEGVLSTMTKWWGAFLALLPGPTRNQYNIQTELDASTSTQDAESRGYLTGITEISTAYHNGMADVADAVADRGIEVQKRWLAQPDACPTCEENAEDGWIPEDIIFASGDDSPPAHPACRCSIEYR